MARSPYRANQYRRLEVGYTPDQLAALGSWIARDWGDFGYRIYPTGLAHVESDNLVADRRYDVFEVSFRDGSRFHVGVDRYGVHLVIGDC